MRQRILADKPTHQEVIKAVRKFLEHGGIIEQLPDQKSELMVVIGGEKYEDFESLTDIIPS